MKSIQSAEFTIPNDGIAKVRTPHIEAGKADFAPTVLMPGDPLRAQYFAQNFLQNARQVNNVRGMLGFTGYYQGQQLSIMGSGMGTSSMSIYANELFSFYGVENIVRIGSAGSLQDTVKIGDIIIAMGASTDSNVNRKRLLGHDFAAIADFHLLETAIQAGRKLNIQLHIGGIISAELFYDPRSVAVLEHYRKMNILAVEMEAAALYGLAAELGKRALCLLTVSDHIFTGDSLSSEARQKGFTNMIKLALETAIHL